MTPRRLHHALTGALALAAALALSACTIAIGAPPEGAAPLRESPPPRTARRTEPRRSEPRRNQPPPPAQAAPARAPAEETVVTVEEEAPVAASLASAPGRVAPGASLLIPVQGVSSQQLRDSYDHARSGGRVHHAIDIMAPGGTPVLAAANGTIRRLRQGGLGGITVYQIGDDGRTLYYYAHLQRYADGLREGMPVRQGEVIAYVGDTGNAGPGNYHLHFSVGRINDLDRWWESENQNPYPLLTGDAGRSAAGNRR